MLRPKVGYLYHFKHMHNKNECYMLVVSKNGTHYWNAYDPERPGVPMLVTSKELTPIKQDYKAIVSLRRKHVG